MASNISVEESYRLEQGLVLRAGTVDMMEAVQLRHLQAHLKVASKIPFYQNMFVDCGLELDDFAQIQQLGELPLTSRQDLDHTPASFGGGGGVEARDIALTSGTTGAPVVIPYTARDLHRLAYNEAVSFYSAGLRPGNRAMLTVTLDRCFIAGLAYYSGITQLGATAIRSGPGQPSRQWQIIERLQPACLVGVPSFLVELGEWGLVNGFLGVGKTSPVRTIVTIGEPTRKSDFSPTAQGERLQQLWGANIFSSYGATEFECAFGECSAGMGGHVHPELMVVEIVDENGRIVPDGEPGEVVVTPLGVEGFPLVRFRTGDIARLHRGACSCGWNSPRLGPVEGRLAQRLKYRGTTFYPENIFFALQEWLADAVALVEVRQAADGADDVCVVVGCQESDVSPEAIAERLQAHLRVRPQVKLKTRDEVERIMFAEGGRKPKKFFDFRP